MSLRIVFCGTPDIAVPTLQKLIASEHEVVAVYTQPDRPAGRGKKLTPSPIKELVVAHNIAVFQPLTFKDEKEQQRLSELKPDVIVVVAYGMLLPQAVLDSPKYGCINLHTSLLPKWRGATPIQSALLAGDKKTGVSIMRLVKEMDAGPVILQREVMIAPEDTSGSLHEKLGEVGANMMLEVIALIEKGEAIFTEQNHAQATHCKKINKADAEIDWHLSAENIVNCIRAYNPWPVAFTELFGDRMRVWFANPVNEKADKNSGEIIKFDKTGLYIATGDGIVQITQMQMPGKKVMVAADFFNAYRNKF